MTNRPPCYVLSSMLLLLCTAGPHAIGAQDPSDRLPGTEPLASEGDVAMQMVAGVDKFLLREMAASTKRRARHWKRDFSSPAAYNKSIESNRQRLKHILGVRDPRLPFDAPDLLANTKTAALVARGENYDVFVVRWPVLSYPGPGHKKSVSIHGEGLLLVPMRGKPQADVIAIPDADQTPEQIAGLVAGVPPNRQLARRLAENGCRVIVPTLISRQLNRRGHVTLSNREWVYRAGFLLGRHLIGYEVQKVLACVDWFEREHRDNKDAAKIGVVGYGEGGAIALYSAAIDVRIDATCVSGCFSSMQDVWKEPVDRNVFGLLDQFGAAELASMVISRALIVDSELGPDVTLPGKGGAPGRLLPKINAKDEFQRFLKIVDRTELSLGIQYVDSSGDSLDKFFGTLTERVMGTAKGAPRVIGKPQNTAARQNRQVDELDRHNQRLLAESEYVRKDFMKKLDTSSVAAYEKSVESYRRIFRDEVIGHFDTKRLPFSARSRKIYDKPKWTGYEVVLDVCPDVIAYGILLLPKNLKPGEKRPVVVCQHGLEGRPQQTIAGDHRAYHDFAAKLCERGFIVFAPQNPYIGGDRFRSLQRKANPLGKTLFSIIVPQHQQIVDWLKTQPFVDKNRIAFYGLSYGGKSAMRIPPLVPDYCLSICSADFNEWVDKNASTRSPYSYMIRGEYEIFEFDLGSTFNYAEMAALIAPRPFMVERGHFDGVADDTTVAREFAKVRHLYNARLKLPDRCRIEWFPGPHTINGQGTFKFLHEHLKWPLPTK